MARTGLERGLGTARQNGSALGPLSGRLHTCRGRRSSRGSTAAALVAAATEAAAATTPSTYVALCERSYICQVPGHVGGGALNDVMTIGGPCLCNLGPTSMQSKSDRVLRSFASWLPAMLQLQLLFRFCPSTHAEAAYLCPSLWRFCRTV